MYRAGADSLCCYLFIGRATVIEAYWSDGVTAELPVPMQGC